MEFEKFDNKTLLISGLIICAILAIIFNIEQLALAIVSGLVGYLSKDVAEKYVTSKNDENSDEDDT